MTPFIKPFLAKNFLPEAGFLFSPYKLGNGLSKKQAKKRENPVYPIDNYMAGASLQTKLLGC